MSIFDDQSLPYDKEHAKKLLDTKLHGAWIEQRKQGNTMLSYIGGHIVIRLLNKAFNGAWSFEILEEQLIDSLPKPRVEYINNKRTHVQDKEGNYLYDPQPPYIRVKGRMEVPGMGIREQYGTKVLIGGATEQEHASKAAATDALKKCASLYGVGLELYGEAEGLIEGYHNMEDVVSEDLQPAEPAKVPEKPAAARKAPAKAAPAQQAPTENGIEKPREASAPAASPEPAPEKAKVQWDPKDIEELKSLKSRLDLQDNVALNPFMVEFFQSPDATYKLINESNVKDVNRFLTSKLAPEE